MDFVKLTIVQPRGFHPDGPVRSEVIRYAELVNWAYNVLRPAMQSAGQENFVMGPHCQFCPAKLACPEHRKLATDAALVGDELRKPLDQFDIRNTDDEWLGYWYGKLSLLDFFKKAVRDETARRMLQLGRDIPNAKRVFGIVDRVWKEAATKPYTDPDLGVEMKAPIEMFFGDDAWQPRALKSPAQIEKLPGGTAFCAQYAQKPRPGLTIAGLSDKRAEQKHQSDDEVFKDVEVPA